MFENFSNYGGRENDSTINGSLFPRNDGELEVAADNIFAAVLTLICVATLFFNTSLIYIIARTKALHTSTNCIIVSLSSSDLLMGTCVMPVAIACRLRKEWIFSAAFCQATGVLNSVGNSVTILSMMSVAIDRYIAVSRPLKYNNIMGPGATVAILIFIWMQSIAFAIMPVFSASLGSYGFISHLSTCSLKLDGQGGFFFTKSILCVILPYMVITVMLLLILKAAKSHHRIFTALPLPFTMPLAGAPSIVNYKRSTMKAMRALFVIICSYVFLWTPYTILSLLELRGYTSAPALLLVTSGWLGYASSAVNPLIITALNKKFKEKFSEMICCQKQCCEKRNRVGPDHIDHHTHVTAVHSTYDTRAGRSHVISHANHEPVSQVLVRAIVTTPIVRLQPPTPPHLARR